EPGEIVLQDAAEIAHQLEPDVCVVEQAEIRFEGSLEDEIIEIARGFKKGVTGDAEGRVGQAVIADDPGSDGDGKNRERNERTGKTAAVEKQEHEGEDGNRHRGKGVAREGAEGEQ